MTPSSAYAALRRDPLTGEDYVELCVLALNRHYVYELEPLVAERLLYDLHSITQTLRGVNKPHLKRARVRRMFQAMRGR